MSGSPAEILQVWDMLRGVADGDQYLKAIKNTNNPSSMPTFSEAEQKQRSARSAGANAFLIANGFHSAVEVLEGTLIYTGQSMRAHSILTGTQTDAAHLFGNGAATMLIVEQLKEATATQTQ